MRNMIVVSVVLLAATGAGRANDRPNIILICADDLVPRMTGFEGHPLVRTPHLDSLAAGGVRFTRSYTPTPQCAPARACILTGQYPHTHGVTKPDMPLSPRTETFTARLKRNGYICGIVGKWDLPFASAEKPGCGLVDYRATNGKKLDWNKCPVWINGKAQTADKFLTDWHGDRAIEFVETFHDRSFFLWLAFRAPHEPLVHPPGAEDMYPPDSIDVSSMMPIDTESWAGRLRACRLVGNYKVHKSFIRQDLSKYYAMITRMDENVGRLLKRLDELGLRDNTVVIFTADNGFAIGDHGLYGMGAFFFDELARVPLVIRYPLLTKPGTVIDRVVSHVDLAPTLCELAGLAASAKMHGVSLLRLLNDPQTKQHIDERFFEYEYDDQAKRKTMARGIVSRRYKYIDYLSGKDDVLCDLERDPDETHNLAGVPQYAPLIKVLNERIDHWRTQTKDLEKK